MGVKRMLSGTNIKTVPLSPAYNLKPVVKPTRLGRVCTTGEGREECILSLSREPPGCGTQGRRKRYGKMTEANTCPVREYTAVTLPRYSAPGGKCLLDVCTGSFRNYINGPVNDTLLFLTLERVKRRSNRAMAIKNTQFPTKTPDSAQNSDNKSEPSQEMSSSNFNKLCY